VTFSDTFPPLNAYLAEDQQQRRDAIKAGTDEYNGTKATGDTRTIEMSYLAWAAARPTSDDRDLPDDLIAAREALYRTPPEKFIASPAGSRPTLSEALAAAKANLRYVEHARRLIALAPDLANEQHAESLREVVAITKTMPAWNRIPVLTALALHLTGNRLTGMLEVLKSDDESVLASTLSAIASRAEGEISRKALAILLAIGDVFTRPSLLKAIIQLTDMIAQIGGEPALLSLQKGTSDTARWYP
jgi:hypothetical protein